MFCRANSVHAVFSLSDTGGVAFPGIVFEFTYVTFSLQILFENAAAFPTSGAPGDISMSAGYHSFFPQPQAFRDRPRNLNALA